MPTTDAPTLYANILEEIKLRIAAVDHCTLGRSGLAPPFVKEFCYLQIRMICELLAVGCLVAHGDIKGTANAKLQTEWSADKIIKTLSALHPNFYPLPVRITLTKTSVHLQKVSSPLDQPEFLQLYGRCGDMLHKGSVQKPLRAPFPVQVSYPELTKKLQKIVDLLSAHVIVMYSGEQMYLARLNNPDDANRVQIASIKTPKGQPMDFKSPDFLRDPPPPK
jgi:hypothetical protein